MSEFPKDHPGAVVAQNIANQFYELLCVIGGVNYVEVQFDDTEHPENPSIAILVQKVGAVTPAEKVKHLLGNLQLVKSKLLALHSDLGAPDYDVDAVGVRERLRHIIDLIEDK